MSMPSDRPRIQGNGRADANAMDGNSRSTPGELSHDTAQRLTRALGWFSVGLGLAALAAPQRIAQLVGLGPSGGTHALVRAIGVRELASGLGILTQEQPANWLWARVGGDAMDLALLTKAMGDDSADRSRVAATTAAVIGVTAVDALATRQVSQGASHTPPETTQATTREPRVVSAVTVNAPIGDVVAAWEGFTSLPRFMDSFATVRVTDDRLSHWQMSLPGGFAVTWDAVIMNVVPNERIAWRTEDPSQLSGSGEVRFRPAPGDRGTEVVFEARFDAPGGELGSKLAGLFTDPLGVKLNNDLRRFKQLTELGEIVKSDDTVVKGPNPAQPAGSTPAT